MVVGVVSVVDDIDEVCVASVSIFQDALVFLVVVALE